MQWILNPITLYSLAALSLLGCLALFVTTKMEVASVRRMAVSASSEVAAVREAVDRERAEAEAAGTAGVSAPAAVSMGLNLNTRAQALRMHKRGESVPGIAAALQTPQGEIQLLLKVHSLMTGAQAE